MAFIDKMTACGLHIIALSILLMGGSVTKTGQAVLGKKCIKPGL
jgi:hypothetical protein